MSTPRGMTRRKAAQHEKGRFIMNIFRSGLMLLLAMPAFSQGGLDEELLKTAREATARVVGRGRAVGTAFCIDTAGFFLTNQQVAEQSEDGMLTLVFAPGRKNERKLTARVVRGGTGADFALLKTETPVEKALPLGDDERLQETAKVTALGYSLESGSSAGPRIKAARITSLLQEAGRLIGFRTDTSVVDGFTGGPLLDDKGRVVGVFGWIPQNGQTSLALPVSTVRTFLSKPLLRADFPKSVPGSDRYKPLRFEVSVAAFTADTSPDALSLFLDDGREERQVHADRTSTGFSFETPLLVQQTAPSVRLKLTTTDSELTCLAKENALQGYLLSELDGYERGKGLLARDGRTLPIDPENTTLTINVTDEPTEIPLKKIDSFYVDPREEPAFVRYRLSAYTQGVVSAGLEGKIRFGPDQAGRPPVGEPGTVPSADQVPKPFTGTIERSVPSPIGKVTRAGSGRYLLLQMDKIGRLAIFDVFQLKVVKILSLAEPATRIAGGASTFVTVLPNQKIIQRWSLETLEIETSQIMTQPGYVTNIGMGYGSEGPLMIRTNKKSDRVDFIDLQTFEPIPHLSDLVLSSGGRQAFHFSQDGQMLSASKILYSLFEGKLLKGSAPRENAMPGPHGDYFYTPVGIYASNEIKVADLPADVRAIPSALPDYYLGLESPKGSAPRGSIQLSLFARNASRPVLTFPTPEIQLPNGFENDKGPMLDQWVHYIPRAAVLITIPPERNRLVARYVDLETHLREAELDYFFVDSIPVTRIAKGATYQYRIQAKSTHSKVRYTLIAGHEGMVLDEKGLLSWHVPKTYNGSIHVVVGLRRGDGRELLHAFKIVVVP